MAEAMLVSVGWPSMRESILRHGWPMTKAGFVRAWYQFSGEIVDFPLDAEMLATVPDHLCGRLPSSVHQMFDMTQPKPAPWPVVDPRRAIKDARLRRMKKCGWTWSKASYVRALFKPGEIPVFPLDAALVAKVPQDLPGAVPASLAELIMWSHPAPPRRGRRRTR